MSKLILSLSVFLFRVCGRLRLGRWARIWPYLLLKTFVRPANMAMTSEEAEAFLQSLNKDPHSSALCHNAVITPARYDLMVVIPVYKVERFLEACLRSVLTQETRYAYHVVAVNDGSPDGCGEILSRYESDPRVTVITQENRGLSGARNSALERIDARYVTFLDSDDLFAPHAIERLMAAAYRYDADIVEGSYQRRTPEGRLFAGEKSLYEGPSSRESLKGFPWMKVIRAEMFEQIHFPEGYWFEDTVMGMLLLPLAKRTALIKDDVYYYTYNTSGISFTAGTKPKSIDGLYVTRALLEDARRLGALQAAPDYQYRHFLRQLVTNRSRAVRLGPDVELAMFVLSCDLWQEYFAEGFTLDDPTLMPIERALRLRDFEAFRRACCLR